MSECRLSFNAGWCQEPLRFLTTTTIPDLHKNRDVTTNRHVDAQRFQAALGGEVLRQPFAQLASIVANNIVLSCAIARQPVKYLHPNLLLGDLALTAF